METTIENISPPQVAAVAAVIADSREKTDVAQVLEVMVSRLRDVLRADGVIVELEQDGQLICCYASGHARRWLGRREPVEGTLAGSCFERDEAVVSRNVRRDPRFRALAKKEPEVRSMLSVPLQVTGDTVGIVRVMSGTKNFFVDDDLVVCRLVGSAIRRLLVHAVREQEGGHSTVDFISREGLWAMRDRRRAEQRQGSDPYAVSLVSLEITGYLTSEILGHVSMLVRATDECFQKDAGTYAIVMPGTTVEEAQVAGARIKRELEAFAQNAADDITVEIHVEALETREDARQIA